MGFSAMAQDFPEYDEFTVEMNVPRMGVVEIPIAIKEETAYISVTELFDMFSLKNEFDSEAGSVSGFIINPNQSYLIDTKNNILTYRSENYNFSASDYILTPTDLYIRSDLFGKIFGLNTDFNFRELNISFKSDLQLPVFTRLRQNRLRGGISRQTVFEPDTVLPRKNSLLKGGMLDWGVISTQQTNGVTDNRVNLGIGAMILGGETNVLLNYSNRVPFTSRNQFYQWRYVNNDSKLFKQVTAGKIFTGATSSLFAPVVGVQFSNSPLLNRRSYGTYVLNDYTEANWTVELYVNNVLVNYTKADASGFFSFEVPLMYGNTNVALQFYGPYGEERREERIINIPYNFVPEKKLEFTLSAGVLEDRDNRKFSRFQMNYGLSRNVSLGAGVEYLSEVSSGEVMPFVQSSFKLAPNLLLTTSYNLGVKGEGLLSYRTVRGQQFDLNYVKYHEDQTAINYNYLEDRKFSFSSPIRFRHFSAFTRFRVDQLVLPNTEFTTAQWLVSGVLFGISTNATTFAIFNDRLNKPTIYSSLSQTYRLPARFLFTPQVQYDLSDNALRNLNLEVERVIFRNGFLNLSYENNFIRNVYNFEVGLRYNLNFAQTSATARIGNRYSSFIQSARGSLRYDDNLGRLHASDRNAVGRGGISIIPFLDVNGNGQKEENERLVSGLKLLANPGVVTRDKNDEVIRIDDLQPYVKTLIKLDATSLENIAWKIENPFVELEILPNQYRAIYVPVKVLGEVSGMVYLKENGNAKGQGRIRVHIFDAEGNLVRSILTETDGYFNYLGLAPGNYSAEVDSLQLEDLGLKSNTARIPFTIQYEEYGAIVDSVEFTLTNQEE
ncbi:MAG: hypothetical protein VX712_07150 [Bacteroidota bacterium]|nr:hypothetical protein [Bacteroidota bacterium]